ncbi:MAG: hypothetical protein WAP51_00210 [Candidatus Sungiibacteriota bacterium]
MKTSERVVWWALFVAFLAIYLNIGWALGTYFNGISGKPVETSWQKFWHGGFGGMVAEPITHPLGSQIAAMFLWPVLLLITVADWVFYGIYLILWLIFAGGLAKLVGLG